VVSGLKWLLALGIIVITGVLIYMGLIGLALTIHKCKKKKEQDK